jgi:two-component system NarL family response regulator
MAMLRTLIIDDNPLFLDSLTELLGNFPGVSVVGTARTGAVGLRKTAELSPDLVFLDLNMPGLGGMQVAEQLSELYPQLRVVIVSWHDDTEYRARAAAIGVERFVCKSDLFAELLTIINAPPGTLSIAGATP